MGMRHIGRHVQIIAKFCSIIVHMVELMSTRTLSVSSTLYFSHKARTCRIKSFGCQIEGCHAHDGCHYNTKY